MPSTCLKASFMFVRSGQKAGAKTLFSPLRTLGAPTRKTRRVSNSSSLRLGKTPEPIMRARQKIFALSVENGAQGRNRTTDTAIFSRMLYQLSYLGTWVAGCLY